MHTLPLVGAALNTLAPVAPRPVGALLRRMWSRPGAPRPVAEADRDMHERARTETLRAGRWDVATYAWGDGVRPVLLVHGWASRASRFAPLVRRLLDLGYSAVSWDAPGHGATPGPVGMVPDAVEIIRRLQERHGRFHAVIAHSLGAAGAVHALREGVRADRLVLVAGVAELGTTTEEFTAALGLGPRAVRALRRSVERHHFGGDPSVWERFSTTHAPGTVTRPALLVHDVDDARVPVEQARLTLAALGGPARLVTTSGLGHNRILTDGAVIDRIAGFVRGVPAPARSGD
ncbi:MULTISPECIES: alpha/beta hydrolase [unclassified Nocardiopsis]|uniref:alpha/beta hydrolase n=1 Tax=unclassified Nocardiopsis TaxID=2649073 RepID=UPI00135A0250|nr:MULTISPECIES: alpha/beta hydrolase [unclassified Nocardiopsis]